MQSVLIIEAQMKRYRLPFYARLNEALHREGIRLTVAYSDPPQAEATKKDTCELPEEFGLKVNGYWLWPDRLLLQPLLKRAITTDLVVLDHGNRFLLNHLLLPLSRLGLRRVAFWGHVENQSERRIHFAEWYRRKTLNWVSWWFAYTEGDARRLRSHGVPHSRITVVQNSVDTQELGSYTNSLTMQDRETIRARHAIPAPALVGVFCGALTPTKSLSSLIEASRRVKAHLPAFQLIIIGGGAEEAAVKRLLKGLDWVHCVGPQFGKKKAELLAISDVFLLPGAVGLAVLDAFAAGLPMLTTRIPIHGPEIEYLEEGVNGLMTDPQPEAYAEAVSSVLSVDEHLSRLRAGAKASSGKYSIEAMVANFRDGIRLALRNQTWARKPLKELPIRSE
jgi:glycosyltransferase involved in cell wall biosynthesis